jgi:hypothetical protein
MRNLIIIITVLLTQGVSAQFDIISQSDPTRRFRSLELMNDSVFIFGDENGTGVIAKSPFSFATESTQNAQSNGSFFESSRYNNSIFGFGLNSTYNLLNYNQNTFSFDETALTFPMGGNEFALCFIDSLTGFFAYQDAGAGLFKTTDKGQTWVEQLDTSYLIHPTGVIGAGDLVYENDTLFGISGIVIVSSHNKGNTWYRNIISNYNGSYKSIDKRNNLMICAGIGYNSSQGVNFGAIAMSYDYGDTWITHDFNDMNRFEDVVIVNDSVIYAVGRGVGQYESIYKSTDAGLTWQLQYFNQAPTSTVHLNKIKCLDEDNCIACGENGLIVKSASWNWVSVKEEANIESNINIYPNPSSSIFNIESEHVIESFQVLDQLGKEILFQNSNSMKIQVDLNGFSKGIYFVRIEANGYEVVEKLIKE